MSHHSHEEPNRTEIQDLPDDLWPAYTPVWEKTDKRLAQVWDLQANGIIVFASLFSATVAAFLVESRKDLTRELDTTVLLLSQISQQLAGILNANATDQSPSDAEIEDVSVGTELVNTFWIISLILGLFTAISAVTVQQSLRTYQDHQEGVEDSKLGTPAQRARAHYYLLRGAHRWGLVNALHFLNIVLHISFFLFLAGLVIWFSDTSDTVYHASLVVAVAVGVVYTTISVFPLILPEFPFYTPLTTLISWTSRIVLTLLYGAFIILQLAVVVLPILVLFSLATLVGLVLGGFVLLFQCLRSSPSQRRNRNSGYSRQDNKSEAFTDKFIRFPLRPLWENVVVAITSTSSVLLTHQGSQKRILRAVNKKKESLDRSLLSGLFGSFRFLIGGQAKLFVDILVSKGFEAPRCADYILWSCSDSNAGIRELFCYITLCRLHLCMRLPPPNDTALCAFLRATWRVLARMAEHTSRRTHVILFLTYGSGHEDEYITLHGGCGPNKSERSIIHFLSSVLPHSDSPSVVLMTHCVFFLALHVTCMNRFHSPIGIQDESDSTGDLARAKKLLLYHLAPEFRSADLVRGFLDHTYIDEESCQTTKGLEVNAPFYFLTQFIHRVSPCLGTAQDSEIEFVERTLDVVIPWLRERCSDVHPSVRRWFMEELQNLREGTSQEGESVPMQQEEVERRTRLADSLSPIADGMPPYTFDIFTVSVGN